MLRRIEFIRWWAEVEPDLLRMALSLGLRDNARDVVQEVAVLAVRQYEQFTDFSEFRKWVRARLYWLALDDWSSRARISTSLDQVIAGLGTKPVQEELVMAAELRRRIEELPGRQREVMKRTLQGESVAEIAHDLNIASATVRSLLRFARRALFRRFTEGESR